jgi:hypothetical protein
VIRLLIAVLIAVPCAAAELAVRDLRLGLVTRPGEFDYTVTSPLSEVSGTDAFDAGLSAEAGLRWSFSRTGDSLGLIGGADLAIDTLEYGSGDGLATGWGRLAGGVGWALTDRLTVTGEAMAGVGWSLLSLPATAMAPAVDASGLAIAYELRAGAVCQATRGVGLGAFAGWLVSEHEVEDDDLTITLEQSGWYVGVQAVWRLDDAPPPLE